MPLVKGKVKALLIAFSKEVNASPSKDQDDNIAKYAQKIEDAIYDSIKDITITIPPGMVITTCSVGGGSNPAPIVLQGQIVIT